MHRRILLIGITVFFYLIFCIVTITVGGKPSIRVPHKVALVAPTSLNVFLDDLEIIYDGFLALFKYADDSTIVAYQKGVAYQKEHTNLLLHSFSCSLCILMKFSSNRSERLF